MPINSVPRNCSETQKASSEVCVISNHVIFLEEGESETIFQAV